jgi:superfamily II DNA or RNA helicase
MEEIQSWRVLMTNLMDADLYIHQVDEVFCRVVCNQGLMMELQEKFTFLIEGHKWHPKVKRGLWDGKIRMLNSRNGHIKKGLIPEIIQWCEDNKLVWHIDDDVFTGKSFDFSDDDIIQIYKKIGAPYTPKEYQIQALKHIFSNKRCMILSPTGSGKSYMLYGLARFYQKLGLKVLIVVHRVGLVKQLIEDNFEEEYDNMRGSFSTHQIYSGKEKSSHADFTASTWQSIVNLPESFYDNFDVIIADEVHAWKAMSTVQIMEKCKNIIYRVGVTGTLDDIESNLMSLTGDFGPPQRVAETVQLMDSNDLARLKIKACLLQYDEKYRKYVKNRCAKYPEEIDFIKNLDQRNEFISKLTMSLKGNTLIAFKNVDHGKILYDMIDADYKFYIDGGVHVDKRSEYQKNMDLHDNVKGVVSVGTFAEGINIKNINYIILACPLKTKIKLLQLIGRGLRLSETKSSVVFIDIGDDISYKNRKNWSLLHYMERIKRYNLEGFDIEYIKHQIK